MLSLIAIVSTSIRNIIRHQMPSAHAGLNRLLLVKLIDRVLPSSRDVEHFMAERYPRVHDNCSAGMDRKSRLTQLLQTEAMNLDQVLANLFEFRPGFAEREYAALLNSERPLPEPDSSASPAPPLIDPLRLRFLLGHADKRLLCDRDPEWTFITTFSERPFPKHEIAFLQGAIGEAHDELLHRVQRLLPRDPPRRVVKLEWDSGAFPLSEKESRACLARYFDCSPRTLPDAIRKVLRSFNLVLLHPCISSYFEHASLRQYYLEWLPGLLAGLDVEGGLKVIQPIAWPRAGWLLRFICRRILGWFPKARPDWLSGTLDEWLATQLIKDVSDPKIATLKATALPPLRTISEADLYRFCDMVPIEAAERRAFVRRVLRRATTTEEILGAISDHLPRQSDDATASLRVVV